MQNTIIDMPAPRINNLSSISLLRANLNIDGLFISVLSDEYSDIRQKISTIYSQYESLVIARGGLSHNVKIAKRVMIHQLTKLSVDPKLIRSSLQDLSDSYRAFFSSSGVTDEAKRQFHKNVQNWINVAIDNYQMKAKINISETSSGINAFQFRRPILSVDLMGIHMSQYHLMYDKRMSLNVEELLLSDGKGFPLAYCYCENIGHFDCLSTYSKVQKNANMTKTKDKKSSAQSKRDTSTSTSFRVDAHNSPRKRLSKKSGNKLPDIEELAMKAEANSISAFSAIVLTYTEQDTKWSWGEGGNDLSVLYKKPCSSYYSKRIGRYTLDVKKIELMMAPIGIPQIVEAMLPTVSSIIENISSMLLRMNVYFTGDKHKMRDMLQRKNRMNSLLFVSPSYNTSHEIKDVIIPKMDIAYSLILQSMDCVFSMDNINYLSEVTMKNVNVSIDESITHRARSGYGSARRNSYKSSTVIWTRVNSMEVFDLSFPGNKHSLVIWKERNSPLQNMISAKIVVSPNHCDIKIDVLALRWCFVYKFYLELESFISKSIIAPLSKSYELFQNSKVYVPVVSSYGEFGDQNELGSTSGSSNDSDDISDAGSANDSQVAGQDAAKDDHPLNYFEEENIIGMKETQFDSLRPPPFIGSDWAGSSPLPYIGGKQSPSHQPRLGVNQSSVGGLNKISPSKSSLLKKKKSYRYTWMVQCINSTMIFPRNANSDDLVALETKRFVMTEKSISESWSPPKEPPLVFDESEAYYFNMKVNDWMWSDNSVKKEVPQTLPPEALPSTPKKSTTRRIFRGMSSIVLPDEEVSASAANMEEAFDDEALFSDAIAGPSLLHTESKLSDEYLNDNFVTTRPMSRTLSRKPFSVDFHEKNFSESSDMEFDECTNDINSSDDEFMDTLDMSTSFNFDVVSPEYNPITSAVLPTDDDGSSDSGDSDVGDDIERFSRYSYHIEGALLYCSLGSSQLDVNSHSQVNPLQHEYRRFVEIKSDTPVYAVQNAENNQSYWSQQKWKCLMQTKTNMLVVIDYVKDSMRMLFSETEHPTSFEIQATMAELYVLISCYYDNMYETQMPDDDSSSENVGNKTTPNSKHISKPKDHAPLSAGLHPEYGTKEYISFILRRLPTFELLFMRSRFGLTCSFDDRSYFSKPLYSHELFCNDAYDDSFNRNTRPELEPFSVISLEWMCVHTKSDDDVLQFALGIGKGCITDLRKGVDTVALNLVPHSLGSTRNGQRHVFKHGYADFNFGYYQSPTNIKVPVDIPLKVTYSSVGYNWGTCNVGSDAPDFDMKNLDIVWMLVDYFSMYFRFPEYGNPSVLAYSLTDQFSWPYSGVDTRLFITRPHIQMSEMSSFDRSQTLAIEAETGIYFRYIYDSLGSIRYECHAHGVSIVLMKSYMSSSISRGLRGTAGSGRGIRTIVELLSFEFSYHFDKLENHLDMLLSIQPSSDPIFGNSGKQSKKEKDVNSKTEALEIPGTEQPPGNPISFGREEESEKISSSLKLSSQKMQYVDFDEDSLLLQSCKLPTAKLLTPIPEASRAFPRLCCNIISSVEDLLFIEHLLHQFLDIQSDPALATAFKIKKKVCFAEN